MTQPTPQFYLIDAHNFLHRNYHALPKLSTSTGLEVGALYGFLRWILKMLKSGNSQREIAKELHVSLCKITRGAAILKDKNAITNKILIKEKK